MMSLPHLGKTSDVSYLSEVRMQPESRFQVPLLINPDRSHHYQNSELVDEKIDNHFKLNLPLIKRKQHLSSVNMRRKSSLLNVVRHAPSCMETETLPHTGGRRTSCHSLAATPRHLDTSVHSRNQHGSAPEEYTISAISRVSGAAP